MSRPLDLLRGFLEAGISAAASRLQTLKRGSPAIRLTVAALGVSGAALFFNAHSDTAAARASSSAPAVPNVLLGGTTEAYDIVRRLLPDFPEYRALLQQAATDDIKFQHLIERPEAEAALGVAVSGTLSVQSPADGQMSECRIVTVHLFDRALQARFPASQRQGRELTFSATGVGLTCATPGGEAQVQIDPLKSNEADPAWLAATESADSNLGMVMRVGPSDIRKVRAASDANQGSRPR